MTPAEALPASDQVGAATLERMAAAPRFNRWMFERLRPWIGRRVLEVGAGIGNISAFVVDHAGVERVVLTDTEPFYLNRLRERFAGRPQVAVAELRLPARDPRPAAKRLAPVVCLNLPEDSDPAGAPRPPAGRLLQPAGRPPPLRPSPPATYRGC